VAAPRRVGRPGPRARRGVRGGDEQSGLVLGEHATCGAEQHDDSGDGESGRLVRHGIDVKHGIVVRHGIGTVPDALERRLLSVEYVPDFRRERRSSQRSRDDGPTVVTHPRETMEAASRPPFPQVKQVTHTTQ